MYSNCKLVRKTLEFESGSKFAVRGRGGREGGREWERKGRREGGGEGGRKGEREGGGR